MPINKNQVYFVYRCVNAYAFKDLHAQYLIYYENHNDMHSQNARIPNTHIHLQLEIKIPVLKMKSLILLFLLYNFQDLYPRLGLKMSICIPNEVTVAKLTDLCSSKKLTCHVLACKIRKYFKHVCFNLYSYKC